MGITPSLAPEARVRGVLEPLQAHWGELSWWPAESPFEVMIGAVLTQNTAWRNVERALEALRARISFDEAALLAVPPEELAELLRPAGYYRLKAERLRALCAASQAAGGWRTLSALDTDTLRHWLLAIKGVGPETADDILLYGFERPVFVADAYARRLLGRLGLIGGREGYEDLRALVERALGREVATLKRAHALIVEHGKAHCRARPRCTGCVLRARCTFAAEAPGAGL
ncbi:MAG: endonuclease [Chromatiaceae bacterium]|nr:endonuclease [Chromatiaceae bacterium]